MSMELDAVIEHCVSVLTQGPVRSREEIAALLNRWEEMGLISQQMRAVIMQRLRAHQTEKYPTNRDPDVVQSAHDFS
jgi:hypothetical protein